MDWSGDVYTLPRVRELDLVWLLQMLDFEPTVDIPGMLTRGFRGKVTRQLAGER